MCSRSRIALAASCLALACLAQAPAGAEPPSPSADANATPFRLERVDAALDALIASDAKLRTVASGFGFSDGPVWVRGKGEAGYLLVVNIIGNVINKITPDGHVSVFMDKAGYTGNDFAHDGKLSFIAGQHVLLIGPNCTGVDHQGRIVWCAGQDRALKRLEKDGTTTILADKGDGKRFNGPNDVAIAANGAIYFTDSDVGLRGGIDGGLAEMPNAVWMWKDGTVTKVVDRKDLLTEPNGIALSPDDKYLYLSARSSQSSKMMRYPIKPDGTAGPGEVFVEGPGIGDGMKTDPNGNIYSTGPYPGVVQITSPQGKVLGLLHMPTAGNTEPKRLICASALAFGGNDAKTLYITACDDVYAIDLRSPGVLEGPAN
ncbi:MAG: SMP-30/gluconolactonase/LRE family protein [Candidatus Andeanibacterium colombiense]|uniref:SMP-30/gluconolactonase/LRE family protein n=1 Tax=Candidatus Andeanibacterium colombiense TaxID=3121345 RepID=A0AAJ5X662_9SPHN|nr:MAG: SMP-30/gluconolactonase/LRE family protein [Sphingomonadaceae bacterium]